MLQKGVYLMKKFILFAVCLFAVVSVSAACEKKDDKSNSSPNNGVSSSQTSSSDILQRPEFKAYADVIAHLTEQYGQGRIILSGEEGREDVCTGICGLSTVRIYDFDGDGVYELYAVAAQQPEAGANPVQVQHFYGYKDGAAYEIGGVPQISNGELDYSPFAKFYICDGKVYYHNENASSGTIYTVSGGEMQPVITYDKDPWEQTSSGPTLNGEPKTVEEIDAAVSRYADKGQSVLIFLYVRDGVNAQEYFDNILSETADCILTIGSNR